MFQKIASYFQNSPKRIAGFWVLTHLFWLIFATLVLLIASSNIRIVLGMPLLILIFPVLIVTILTWAVDLGNDPQVGIGISIFYLLFFLLVIYNARKTSSFLFKVLQTIFAIWFFCCLVIGLYRLFVLFYVPR